MSGLLFSQQREKEDSITSLLSKWRDLIGSLSSGGAGSLTSVTFEHGFVKMLVSRGQQVLGHRVALANPQFYREGMVGDHRRIAAIVQNNLADMGGDHRRILGAVPGYQNNLGRLDLPKAGGLDPQTVIPREARRTMGVSPDTSSLTWYQLPDSFDRTRWIVISATRRSITSFLDTVAAAELPVPTLELRAFSLARAVNRRDAVIAWTAMDGCDIVIVREAIPVAKQSAYWGADPVEGSVLVNRLTDVVGRTIAIYDEQNLDMPLPDDVPLYVCGSTVALDPAIGQQVASNLRRASERVSPPLDIPNDFPVDDMVVNLGLALWGA